MDATLPPLEPVDLSLGSPVSAYLAASTAVCPFIEPAARAGCLHAGEVSPDCRTGADLHPRLFEHLVPAVERFRDARRALPDRPRRLLVCHTVVIRLPSPLDAEAARLLAWPNWLAWSLKQLYTPTEVVFGFVRKGVVEPSMFGRSIPVAPFHAVVIRSRVVGSDSRFFTGNRPLMEAMMTADDDGRNVHAAVFGTAVPDVRDPRALRAAGYFDRVRQWGQTVLPKR